MTIVEELRRFGASHNKNGERRTADLLFRAADHIIALERVCAQKRAATASRNIISRDEWEKLLAEDKALKQQMERYKLPTQRGAHSVVRTKLEEVSARIRAVDGVIGIDA